MGGSGTSSTRVNNSLVDFKLTVRMFRQAQHERTKSILHFRSS